MDLLIAEELLLLALDDEKGATGWLEDWQPLSIGVLVDAIAAGAVTVEDDRVLPGAAPEHPLLRRVHAAVVEEAKTRTLAEWVERLPRVLKPVLASVAEQLVARGVLREEPGRVLLFFRTTNLPEADPGPERALRARLRAVLVDGAAPTPHDVQLVSVMHHEGGCVDAALVGEDRSVRKAAKARAAEIAERAADQPGGRVAGDAAAAAAVAAATTLMITTVVITMPSDGGAS